MGVLCRVAGTWWGSPGAIPVTQLLSCCDAGMNQDAETRGPGKGSHPGQGEENRNLQRDNRHLIGLQREDQSSDVSHVTREQALFRPHLHCKLDRADLYNYTE